MLYRSKRAMAPTGEDIGIPLSSLIDCVFLLLIFFLVTTMLKRKETIIPVVMPEATSSLSAEAHEEVLVLGLGRRANSWNRRPGIVTAR
jgi:biopolymer transport protein ExbD